jgi:hypothetical protein
VTLLAWVQLLLRWLVAGAVLCLPGRGLGQDGAPPATATDVLAEMAGRAGVIFTGQVVGIERADAQGFVDVRFRVATAVKGVSARTASGNFYVLREWAGLWTGGDRYWVGQRFLMLLTARGASGMSAPVDGMDGAVPLVGGGEMPLLHGASEAPADTTLAEAETLVDLRWLQAKALRGASSGGASARSAATARTVMEPVTETGDPGGSAGGGGMGGGGTRGGGTGGGTGVIARPVLGGTEELGWVPVAPLSGGGTTPASGSVPGGTKLSTVLAVLTGGAGSAAR